MCFHDDHTPHTVVVLMFQNIFTYGSIFKSLESKRKSNGRFFDASVLRRIKKKKKFPFQRRNRAICRGIMQTPEHEKVGFR